MNNTAIWRKSPHNDSRQLEWMWQLPIVNLIYSPATTYQGTLWYIAIKKVSKVWPSWRRLCRTDSQLWQVSFGGLHKKTSTLSTLGHIFGTEENFQLVQAPKGNFSETSQDSMNSIHHICWHLQYWRWQKCSNKCNSCLRLYEGGVAFSQQSVLREQKWKSG